MFKSDFMNSRSSKQNTAYQICNIAIILILQCIVLGVGHIVLGRSNDYSIKDSYSINFSIFIIRIVLISAVYFILGALTCRLTLNKFLITILCIQFVKIIFFMIYKLSILGFLDALIQQMRSIDPKPLSIVIYFISDIMFAVGYFAARLCLLKNIKNSPISVLLKNILFICLNLCLIWSAVYVSASLLVFKINNTSLNIIASIIYAVIVLADYFYMGIKLKSQYRALIIYETAFLCMLTFASNFFVPMNLYIFMNLNNIGLFFPLEILPILFVPAGYLQNIKSAKTE